MNIPNPNIRPDAGQKPPQIQQLSPTVINRIAAGEVVERPASAVKELVENALDAGATRVQIDYAQGGKSLIRVSDNGHGMGAEDLPLALARHATSKTTGEDLLQIHSFGFRGEALASLAAVARMTLTSRPEGAEAAMLSVDGGEMQPVRPAAANPGTTIELRDLFYATPARLKFLRTDRAEAQAIADTVRRISMAQPWVAFRLRDLTPDPARSVLDLTPETGDMFDALPARLSRLLGPDFAANALRLDAEREGVRLTGLAALPTYARASSTAQYFFVNGRPVKDKLLLGALRAAYMDVLPSGRYPAAALFLDCAPELVDVNVHPAKSEVRFRSPGEVRGLVVGALRHRLAEAGHRSSSTLGPAALGAARPETSEPRIYQSQPRPSFGARQAAYAAQAPMAPSPEAPATESFAGFAEPSARIYPAEATEPTASLAEPNAPASDLTPDLTQAPLGAARAQLHGCYIVTQTEDGVMIVDQHAAHERLVYEDLKAQAAENGITAQALLIPDIVTLPAGHAELLLAHSDELTKLGLSLEPFGPDTIAVRETPALLGTVDAKKLLTDIADLLDELGDTSALTARIDAVLSRMSCHGSIRSGRLLRPDEMNALLRRMEATPYSGQCNHGRPTYVELKLQDIEKLFGRA